MKQQVVSGSIFMPALLREQGPLGGVLFRGKSLLHITELFAPDEPLRVLSTVEKGQHRGLLGVVF